ncbi:MAG: hypothetical protein JNM07_03580 [Phycisphaerae bacterium]|nr:hypothetical protein [Phycisphaerae bacterium]
MSPAPHEPHAGRTVRHPSPPPHGECLISPRPDDADPDNPWRSPDRRIAHPGPSQSRFRSELGLPPDRPIIMSGHQAGLWHAGIAAKWFAVGAAAAARGASAAWVVVDQDTNDLFRLPVPVRDMATGQAARATWNLVPGPFVAAHDGAPTGLIPACSPGPFVPPPGRAPEPGVDDSCARIIAGLAAHAGATSAAEQFARAASDLLAPLAPAPFLFFASAISRTGLFAEIVERMTRDPRACRDAYNAALTEFPDPTIPPLSESAATGSELPLWALGRGAVKSRSRVTSSQVASVERASLAPRALLMTGLLRWAGCELFIHGLGGGESGASGYDRITESWFRRWLGVELAPAAVVTASISRWPSSRPLPSPEAVHRAMWEAHHARHNPRYLGDIAADNLKHELLSAIRDSRLSGRSAAPAFKELHQLLERVRTSRSAQIDTLDTRARIAGDESRSATVRSDRTWPFPFLDPAELERLADRVRAQFRTSAGPGAGP